MPIERMPSGGTMITGHGDLPEGGMDYYVLITAHQAMKMHVNSGGKMRLTRFATPKNIRLRLNEAYPNRPDGPFTGKTAAKLLKEIEAEVRRQKDLNAASVPEHQREAVNRILEEAE